MDWKALAKAILVGVGIVAVIAVFAGIAYYLPEMFALIPGAGIALIVYTLYQVFKEE